MRTGAVEANQPALNQEFKLSYLDDLIARKLEGGESGTLQEPDLVFHQGEYERLRSQLEKAYQESLLPEAPTSRSALNSLLIRLRLS